jgi:hypothetical protein
MTHSINIRPGVGVLALFPHMNYKPWFALGELVDNALASYLANADSLHALSDDYQFRVVIEAEGVDGGSLRVWDNAAGIAASEYERAFVTAEPPSDATGLSQFGIGMKSASCWFARRWMVRTKGLSEGVERTLEFDVPKIVKEGIEQLDAYETAAPESDHYTELRLWNLNRSIQGRTVTKIKDHLASMYRVFLRRGDMQLKFNDEWLTFEEPKILTAPQWNKPEGSALTWRRDVKFQLPTGETVSGFAAIRETGSTTKAGFALFSKERLVMGSGDETYRPPEVLGASNKFRYQRVFGELHLDDFKVSHTKDGFIWGDREPAFLQALKDSLDEESFPLLRQAENYRVRGGTQASRSIASQAVASTASAISAAAQVVEQQLSEPLEDSVPPATVPPALTASTRVIDVPVGDETWEVTIELSSDESDTEWLTLTEQEEGSTRGEPRRFLIRMALNHPFMVNFLDVEGDVVEPLLRIAVAVGLAEVAARDAGVKFAGAIRRNMNELLRVLAHREGVTTLGP